MNENPKRKPVKTGIIGVRSFGNKFQAYRQYKGRFLSIGYYHDDQDAAEAVKQHKIDYPPDKRGRPKKERPPDR